MILASLLPPPPRYKSTRSDAAALPPLATSERATRSPLVQCVFEVVCNYTIAVGKSDVVYKVRKRRTRSRRPCIRHHHHHRASARRDNAGRDIRHLLLSNDKYYYRYDKSRLSCQTASKPNPSHATRPYHLLSQTSGPKAGTQKAYRQSIYYSIELVRNTPHQTPRWTECVLESAEQAKQAYTTFHKHQHPHNNPCLA